MTFNTMDKKQVVVVLLALTMLVTMLPTVSAFQWCEWIPFWSCSDDLNGYTMTHTAKWVHEYENGIQEEYFNTTVENLANGKAKVCLVQKLPLTLRINDDEVKASKASMWNANVKTREVEPSDMEVETEGGKVKKMCVDVDIATEERVKFGEHSSSVAYVDDNLEIKNESEQLVQDITLTYNTDQCLINCEARGTSVLYQDDELFNGYDFVNKKGQLVELEDVDFYVGQNVLKNFTTDTYDPNCTTEDRGNGTQEYCDPFINGSITTQYSEIEYTPYNFETLEAGSYYWKIMAQKDPSESLDWAVSLQGFDTDIVRQYWAWWNSPWQYKRLLSNLTGEYPTINFTREANGNADFSDLRFLDGDENFELNYTVRANVSGEWALITIDTNNYTSNVSSVEGLPYPDYSAALSAKVTHHYTLDETSSVYADGAGSEDGTYVQGTRGITGKIDEAIDAPGIDFANNAFDVEIGDVYSVSFWTRTTQATGDAYYFTNIGASPSWSGTYIQQDGTGLVTFYMYNGAELDSVMVKSTSTVTALGMLNSWHMLTFTYDGTSTCEGLLIYLDGELIPQDCISNDTVAAQALTFEPQIGTRRDTYGDFAGDIDDFLIADEVLTQADILELYNEVAGYYAPAGLPYSQVINNSIDVTAYYSLEDNVEDANGSYDLTEIPSSTVTYDRGFISKGAEFDGSTDCMNNTVTMSGWTGYTMGGWVNTDDLANYRRISGLSGTTWNQLLGITNTGTIRSSVNTGASDTYITGGTTLSANTWYYVISTYNGSHLNLYINGVSDATPVAHSGSLRTQSNGYAVGCAGGFTGQAAYSFWDGELDEIILVDEALNETEILSLYNTQLFNFKGSAYMYYGNENATTTSNVNDTFPSIAQYFTFDKSDTSQIEDDIVGGNDVTIQTARTTADLYNSDGIIGGSIEGDGTTDWAKGDSPVVGDTTLTRVGWFKTSLEGSGVIANINNYGPSGTGSGFTVAEAYTGTGGELDAGSAAYLDYARSGGGLADDEWHFFVATKNNLNYEIYIDGVETPSGIGTASGFGAGTFNYILAGQSHLTPHGYRDGQVDELMLFDEVIDVDYMLELYSMSEQTDTYILGAEEAEDDTVPITITLIEPANGYSSTNPSVFFNCTCTGDEGCVSLNLTVDGQQVNTTVNASTGQNLEASFTNASIPDGSHTWYCNGSSDTIGVTNSSVYTFSIDTTAPEVNITAPLTGFNVTFYNQSIQLNWTATDNTNLSSCWYGYDIYAFKYDDGINITTPGTKVVDGWIYVTDNTTQNFEVDFTGGDAIAGYIRVQNAVNSKSGGYQQINPNAVEGVAENISMTVNGNGWHYFAATIEDNGQLEMFRTTEPRNFAINDTNVSCAANTTTFNYPLENPDDLFIAFFAEDGLGNLGTDNSTINLTPITPTVNLTAPEGFVVTQYNESYDLNWTIGAITPQFCGYNTVDPVLIPAHTDWAFQDQPDSLTGASYDDTFWDLNINGTFDIDTVNPNPWWSGPIHTDWEDGDFDTSDSFAPGTSNSYVYINYTAPNNTVNYINWRYKITDTVATDTNISLATSYIGDDGILRTRMYAKNSSGYTEVEFQVYNPGTTTWDLKVTEGHLSAPNLLFYEEGIWWGRDVDDFYNLTEVTCGDNTTTLNYPITNPDNVTIYFYANESLGQWGNSSTIVYRSTDSPNITLTSPVAQYETLSAGESIDLNWSIVNTTVLDECWYSYDGSNTTVTCEDGTDTFNYADNVNEITLFANDTLGNINSANTTWIVLALVDDIIFEEVVIETDVTTFSAILNLTEDVTTVTGNLIHNGVTYAAVPTIVGNQTHLNRTIDVQVLGDTNVSFHFNITVTTTNSSGTATTLADNQTIQSLDIEICDLNDTDLIVNYTTRVARTPFGLLNTTLASSWFYYLNNGTGGVIKNISYQDTSENNSAYAFCLNFNETVIVSNQVEVSATDYVPSSNFLIGAELNKENVTSQTIYLLNDSLADATVLQVFDQSGFPVGNVLINVQYYDIGTNTYITVTQALTSSIGSDVVYVNWLDSLYKFVLIQDGETVDTTLPENIFESPRIFTLGDTPTFTFEEFEGIDYSLYFDNSTNDVYLTFAKPTGAFVEGCLRVNKRNSAGDTSICDVCSEASSATLICNIEGYGNGTYIASFYGKGSLAVLKYLLFSIGSGDFSDGIWDALDSGDGWFYAFLLGILIVGVSLFSPVLGIMAMAFAMLVSSLIGFGPMVNSVIIGIGLTGILGAWLVNK